jgi:hypothetical protein
MVAEKIRDLLPQEWPLFIGDLPSTADVAVGVMEYDGATSTEYFGASHESLFNPIVKIVIRHSSYPTGQAWADEVKNTLHKYHNEGIGILSILMVGVPMYLGRNEQKLHEFQVTFNISIKE